jgi:ribosome biogenesis ATPase
LLSLLKSSFLLFCRGRLDKLLYVPLPSADDRVSILSALSVKVKFGPDVVLDDIGRSEKANGFSGADCAALLREAGLAVLKEDLAITSTGKQGRGSELCIEARHFVDAFHHVMPSVSKNDQARYDRIRQRMARARTRGTVSDLGESNGVSVTNTNTHNNGAEA